MSYIYVFRNKINHKLYVGQTVSNLQRRISKHFRRSMNPKFKFERAIAKYGKDNFEIFIYIVPENELDYFEIELIKRLNTVNDGYNLDSGGNKQKHMSAESRKKMSENHNSPGHAGFKHTDSAKQKMCLKKLGKPGPWAGKHRGPVSETTKEKHRAATSKMARNTQGQFMAEERN